MPIPSLIPHLIPDTRVSSVGGSEPLPAAPSISLYDVAIGGLKFMYANDASAPTVRRTAPFEKQRIDQAETPGENTLTNWWYKSQDSFHGGAGQLQLEPATPTPVSHVRFDASKNVDVFTPGEVTRLPDCPVIQSDTVGQMVGVSVSGADVIVYIDGAGDVQRLTTLSGTPVRSKFNAAGVGSVTSIATDGLFVYAATSTSVYRLTPSNVSLATKLYDYPATFTNAVLGWAKARLMLGVNGVVYGLDVSIGASHTLVAAGSDAYYLYTHPTAGFTWRCFAESPTAILAAGDSGGLSAITQFDVQDVASVPTLSVDGQLAQLPYGERILSMLNNEGTFLAIGTTKGVRIGQFESYFSRLSYGPLQLLPSDPVIPCNALLARDRFFYAVGMAYDEGGLIAVDLGTKIDEAGRFAWSSHLIGPTFTSTAATAGCVLPISGRIAFYIAGQGICFEGAAPGTVRDAYLTTSRIRYATTEPKLFKLGRIRGDLSTGEVVVTGVTRVDAYALGTFGNTTVDSTEFRLPVAPEEWLQLKFALVGATATLTSYQVKALPGTKRQRQIQPVLSLFDNEILRSGLEARGGLTARTRLEALEALDAAGDEILYQEFTPNGVKSTVVVIQEVRFVQSVRPTSRSDVGGTVTVLMQTVEG